MKLVSDLAIACVIAIVASAGACAEAASEPWHPSAPEGAPTGFDWIRLVSDEWLKGEIVSMYDGELEFDSDELGDLIFDFEDVKEIRSAQVVQVGFVDREPAIGRLYVDHATARVIGEAGESVFPRGEVHTLIAGTPKEINYWSAEANLGGNIRKGNTDQVDYTARFSLLRRSLYNRIRLDYVGNITTVDGADTANSHRSSVGWDHFLSDRLFVSIIKAEWFRDEFQNVRNRYTIGGGFGYELIDTSRIKWTVGAGPAWQSTEFVSVEPGEAGTTDSFAFNIASRFSYDLTKDIEYYLNYDAFFTDKANGTYNHHVDTGLEIELIGNLDFNISWIWDRIEDPRALEDGRIPGQDDYRLVVGLGWDF